MSRQKSWGVLGLFPTGLVVAALLMGGCSSDSGSGGGKGGDTVRLNAGGSTFVYPIMSKWAGVYEKEVGDQINYQSIGSGGGIQKMTSKEFDFGCSDAPLNEEQLKKSNDSGGEVVHIPLSMGAVVPIYNLEEVKEPLQFSGEVLANIFLRKITKWNDEAIKKINPKVADQLPNKNIVVVHRSDGSGTTYVFADYLAKVSPEWKEKVGVSTSLKWADDTTGAKGSEGVSGQVKNNGGAIGYVEMTYALQNKIAFAAMQNQEKEFVTATPETVSTAAANSMTSIPDDLRYSLTNAPGKGAYPISGTVWAIVYVDQPAGKAKHVVDFLRWVTRDDKGQSYANDLHYAPLPKGLIKRIDDKLAAIKAGK